MFKYPEPRRDAKILELHGKQVGVLDLLPNHQFLMFLPYINRVFKGLNSVSLLNLDTRSLLLL